MDLFRRMFQETKKTQNLSTSNDGTDLRWSPSLKQPLSNPTLATVAMNGSQLHSQDPQVWSAKKKKKKLEEGVQYFAGNPGGAEWKAAGTAESHKISGENHRFSLLLSTSWTSQFTVNAGERWFPSPELRRPAVPDGDTEFLLLFERPHHSQQSGDRRALCLLPSDVFQQFF